MGDQSGIKEAISMQHTIPCCYLFYSHKTRQMHAMVHCSTWSLGPEAKFIFTKVRYIFEIKIQEIRRSKE